MSFFDFFCSDYLYRTFRVFILQPWPAAGFERPSSAFFPMDRKVLFRMVASLFGFIAAAIVAVLYIYDSIKGVKGYGYLKTPRIAIRPKKCTAVFGTTKLEKCTEYNHDNYFTALHRITTGILSVIVAVIEILLLLPAHLKGSALLRSLLDCPIIRGFFYLYVGAMTFNVFGSLGSSAALISCFVGLLTISLDSSSYA